MSFFYSRPYGVTSWFPGEAREALRWSLVCRSFILRSDLRPTPVEGRRGEQEWTESEVKL